MQDSKSKLSIPLFVVVVVVKEPKHFKLIKAGYEKIGFAFQRSS